ncbi:MAG TPA: leucine-rich repeat domain-containing protein [Verrucomicrobiae bacterium]
MKVPRNLIQICLLCAAMLPVVVQAQDYTYTTNNGTITITEYVGSDSAVIIPDTINGLPVTSIGDYAFPYSPNLTNVTIGDGITNVGDYAFSDCTSLNTIVVDALNSYYSSADGVLFNQGETTLIQYPASKVGNSYTIPNSVISIGSAAFYYSLA